MAFADVRWNGNVPIRLPDVTGKTMPAEVILESNAAQCSCYRFGRVSVATRWNVFRVSEYQQQAET